MSATMDWPWVVIALLGAWHGLNPGMGWLFAAALGMQEGKGSAAWRALPPLAFGHALSVAASLLVALALGLALTAGVVKVVVAVGLIGYGGFRLVRSGHPRWTGMRVGPRDLTLWSFLMASAHGAGLMVLPFFLAGSGSDAAHAGHAHGAVAAAGSPQAGEAIAAVLLHTGAYLLVTGAIAVAVVSWLGLRLLRTLWVDIDRIWAATLILTGLLALVF